jgi:hypothetical protein
VGQGIFVDCYKRPYSSADGKIQPTSQRFATSQEAKEEKKVEAQVPEPDTGA